MLNLSILQNLIYLLNLIEFKTNISFIFKDIINEYSISRRI